MLQEMELAVQDKIEHKQAQVCVVGLGYVGLPLAIEFAKKGFTVTGIDQDDQKIAQLKAQENYIEDIASEDFSLAYQDGRFQAAQDFALVQGSDVLILCVPTPLNKTWEPDMSYIISACEQVAPYLNDRCLVVLESTTYPGTTEEVILPIFEAAGKKLGQDFLLAFSPERIDPGNEQFKTDNIPKIVAGLDEQSLQAVSCLYAQVVQKVVPVSSPKVAETAKLLENTFRTVNVGLINEIALMCSEMDIDVWEVIEAASSKPFGFMPFYPGPGLGGHCLPIDPLYLAWKAKLYNFETRFIHLATQVNRSMPAFVVSKVSEALNDFERSLKGSQILILGVAYKANVSDIRESPALDVLQILREKGACVEYYDPWVPQFKLDDQDFQSVDLDSKALNDYDAVVILTAHSAYDYPKIVQESRLVVDTRNATKDVQTMREKIVKL